MKNQQEDPLKKLYDVVSSEKLYTKSFDDFKSKYSTDVEINKMFDVVSQEKLYTKDINSFKDKYFASLGKQKEGSSKGLQNTSQNVKPTSSNAGLTDLSSITNSVATPTIPAPLTTQGRATYVAPKAATKPKIDFNRGIEVFKADNKNKSELYSEDPTLATKREQANQLKLQNDGIITPAENFNNKAVNFGVTMRQIIPQLSLVTSKAFQKSFDKSIINSLYSLPRINYSSENGFSIDGGMTIEEVQQQSLNKLEELSKQSRDTNGLIDSALNPMGGNLASAIAGSVIDLAGTAVPNILSGGVSLPVQMIGASLYDYNKKKAEVSGKTIQQLYKDGEDEVRTPVVLGSAAVALEYIGLKGVSNAMTKKLTGSFLKKAATFSFDTNLEGMANWLQTGLEKANEIKAIGGTDEDATVAAVDALFSRDGLEQYLQGTTGSFASATIGRAFSKGGKESLDAVNTKTNELLKDLKNPSLDPQTKDVIIDKIAEQKEQESKIIKVEQELKDNLPEEIKQEVIVKQDELANLTEQAQTNGISETTKDILTEKATTLETEINTLIDTTTPIVEAVIPVSDVKAPRTLEQVQKDQKVLTAKFQDVLKEQGLFEDARDSKLTQEQIDGVVKIAEEQTGLSLDGLKKEAESTQQVDDTIEGVVPEIKPSEREAIQKKRDEIKARLKKNLGNLNAGLNPQVIGDLVELGITYIQDGVLTFKEFADKMKADYDSDIEDTQLRDIFKKSANSIGLNVRRFDERVRVADETPSEIKDGLDELPSLYTQQNYKEIEARLATMTEQEKLLTVTKLTNTTSELKPEENIGVLAGISLYNQYLAEGRTEEATNLANELGKSASVFGQSLRQYAEFKTSTPDGFLELMRRRIGKDLTAAEEAQIKNLFEITKLNRESVALATQTLKLTLTKADRKNRRIATIALEDSQRQLDDFIDEIKGSEIYDLIPTLLQGSLLTLKSQIQNPIGNIFQMSLNGLVNLTSIPIDILVSFGTKKRTRFAPATDAFRNVGYAVTDGVKESYRKATKGTTSKELSKYDVNRRLKPFTAFKRLFIDSFSATKRANRRYSFKQGVADLLESTVGQMANLQFRLLSFGDDAFNNTGRVFELDRRAQQQGLTGDAYDRFIIDPDLESSIAADEAGDSATFQNGNPINDLLKYLDSQIESIKNVHIRGVIKIIKKSIIPFQKTPSSIALKILDIGVPLLPLVRSVSDFSQLYKLTTATKRNEALIDKVQSSATNNMGLAIVGALTGKVAVTLVANGLITGGAPDERERKKEKDFMYATQPPYTLNVAGLGRLLSGGDPTWQQGDKVISYQPFGALGAVFGITEATRGKALREKLRKSKYINEDGQAFYKEEENNVIIDYVSSLASNLPAGIQYTLNQSFLQGTSELLGTLATGDFDRIYRQTAKTYSNFIIPNQVSQFARANNEYLRDTYTEDWKIKDLIKEKYGNVQDLPIKYNMWGEPIKQTPEGINPYIYQVVDLFRTQKILRNDLTFKVFNLYKKTDNKSVIPASVRDSFTSGDFITKLNEENYSNLARIVGEEREKISSLIMKGYNVNETNVEVIEKQIEKLKKAYTLGAKRGKIKFKKQYNIK